ncbi:hypothetical protein I7X12_04475 [Halosimplex litoreum]|uniref:Uncharacterized protein n=1 Tax=Halosimplex litoreum TaxID=1198301 RepID=A0A7T3G0B8_9EURY|nr:hypothetical protein [Halosimplex litoreum]QPV63892.1 hypothetical protein I7X12_04475 [Halosimplex litoreum]
MSGFISITIGPKTAARLDRARQWLDCSPNATYDEIIPELLDEADIDVDLTEEYE